LTLSVTTITWRKVAIIALLIPHITRVNPLTQDTISTHSLFTSVGAGVGVEVVAIITRLTARLDGQIKTRDAITTDRFHTTIKAAVLIVIVAVIALLALVNTPVTTLSGLIIGGGVVDDGVLSNRVG
jgi:hypothetical protein